jgi:hypothetical protein
MAVKTSCANFHPSTLPQLRFSFFSPPYIKKELAGSCPDRLSQYDRLSKNMVLTVSVDLISTGIDVSPDSRMQSISCPVLSRQGVIGEKIEGQAPKTPKRLSH